MTTAPNGELRRQDLHLQVPQLVSLRSLLWVRIEGKPPPPALSARTTMCHPDIIGEITSHAHSAPLWNLLILF